MRPIDATWARADIIEVAKALGCTVRGNRIRATWRDGKGFTVSLSRGKPVFCDHRDGVGGNVFTLVMLILGCGFNEARKWLANFYGIELKHRDAQAVKADQMRRQRATNAADGLAEWRWLHAYLLRTMRNRIWSECRRVERWADAQAGFSEDLRWYKFAEVPERFRLADDIDSYVGYIEQLGTAELIALRRRLEGDGLAA